MRAAVTVLLFAGCAAAGASGKAGPAAKAAPVMGAAPLSVRISAGGGHGSAFVVIGAGVLAERAAYGDARQPPPMDPRREVEEVDCTKPVDFTSGNLRCK